MREKCEKIVAHGINCFVNRQVRFGWVLLGLVPACCSGAACQLSLPHVPHQTIHLLPLPPPPPPPPPAYWFFCPSFCGAARCKLLAPVSALLRSSSINYSTFLPSCPFFCSSSTTSRSSCLRTRASWPSSTPTLTALSGWRWSRVRLALPWTGLPFHACNRPALDWAALPAAEPPLSRQINKQSAMAAQP